MSRVPASSIRLLIVMLMGVEVVFRVIVFVGESKTAV